jgi:hypothetical protein
MFDFKVAYTTLLRIYSLVFKGNTEADYYSYQEAKKAVAGFQGRQIGTLETLEHISKNHKITSFKRRKILDLGIYPWHFLDKHGDLNHLENPMKLILKKLDLLGVLETD